MKMKIQGLLNNRKLIFCILINLIILSGLFVFLMMRPVNNYVVELPEITEYTEDTVINTSVPVKSGSYMLRVGFEAMSGSTITVLSASKPNAVKCDEMILNHVPDELPGVYNVDYTYGYLPGYSSTNMFITENILDLSIRLRNYMGGGYSESARLTSIELIGTRNYVIPIMVSAAFLILLFDYLYSLILQYKLTGDKSKIIRIAFLITTTLLASGPVFTGKGFAFDDIGFSYSRIEGLKDGLLDGQFPVRLYPETFRGFGYAAPYFYPDVFLYPFALMRIAGFSLRATMNCLILCINFATVAVCSYSIRRVFRARCATLPVYLGSFVYTMSLYRLADVLVRGAIAEAIAFIFVPLVVAGVYSIIVEDGPITPLVIGISAIANSHLITCEMIVFFLLIMCIPCYRLVFRAKTLKKLSMSAVMSVLLSMYFVGPFIHMSLSDSFKVFNNNAFLTSENVLPFQRLFALTAVASSQQVDYDKWYYSRYTIGLMTMIITAIGYAVATYVYIRLKKKGKIPKEQIIKRDYKFLTLSMCLGILAFLMTTDVFPWKYIESNGGILKTVICMVQFPWRYLVIASVMFAFTLAFALKIIIESGGLIGINKSLSVSKMTMYFFVPLSVVLTLIQTIRYFEYVSDYMSSDYILYDGNDRFTEYDSVGMGEYEPEDFTGQGMDLCIEEYQTAMDETAIVNRLDNSSLVISSMENKGSTHSLLVINPTMETQNLYIPLLYYDGYRVTDIPNENAPQKLNSELYRTEQGTIALKIPSGYYGKAVVYYKGNMLFRMYELISVATMAGFGFHWTILKKRKRGHETICVE